MVKVKNDLTGKKFGRLTVIKQAEDYISPSNKHYSQWMCKCNCNNESEIIVRSDDLNNGKVQSCGCLKSEKTLMRNIQNKRFNTYDLSGEYGVGYTSKGEEFYFDLEDYNKIKDYTWYKDKRGYIVTSKNRKIIKLHRLIMDFPNLIYDIDHKHGDLSKNDNRKSNLRISTHSQNMMNSKLRSNNKSGVTGVSWDKNQNKWIAYIGANNNTKYLGSFDVFENAVKARIKAEEKYHGEYSYNNNVKRVI